MRLVRVRKCDGACCRESPRWPAANYKDCVFHDEHGCRLMRGAAEIPATNEVLPHLTGPDMFVLTCRQWPHNSEARLGKTGDCCWQWLP